MKFILLFIFPFLTLAQTTSEKKIYLLDKKVEVTVPAQLVEMSDKMYKLKYENRPRPAVVLSDKSGSISLTGNITHHHATESQIVAYRDFQITELKKVYPDLELLEKGVKTVRGKKVGYFKFLSQAIDQKIFNYYFFTSVDGEVVLFNFNVINKIRTDLEAESERIVSSLTIN